MRFLRWASGISDSNFLPYFANELGPFGLLAEPGPSDGSIDEVLDELDFL